MKSKTKSIIKNQFRLVIPSRSQNEAFARVAVSAFASQLDPTIEEINDIKAAVSEAVTNCVVHAYPGDTVGQIEIIARIMSDYRADNLPDNVFYIRIRDKGCGIADIEQAKTPLFTTCAEGERAGLGFAVMESFMDKLKVSSKIGGGTTIIMSKRLVTKQSV
ncbi:MAG: anti-sigma F factor [Oscillospiraceae bacterium]|nr:anti-sigma F factor [Oscillospiraceae bacterium]